MHENDRENAVEALMVAAVTLRHAEDFTSTLASVIRSLSSLHDRIMIDQARGTMDAKRFKKTQRNNTSGWKGVTFNKSAGKWQAKIGNGTGRAKHIGYFGSMEDAIVARAAAEAEMWALRN